MHGPCSWLIKNLSKDHFALSLIWSWLQAGRTHSHPAVTVMAANPPDFRPRLGGIMRALLTGPRGAATMQEAFQQLGPSIANLRPPVFRCTWPAPRSPVLALRALVQATARIIGLGSRPAARCADRAGVRCRGQPAPPKSRRSV